MRIIKGNLFSFQSTHKLVIPTNIGWNSKGIGIMGAGVALEASKRSPGFAEWWGEQCMLHGKETPVMEYNKFISFPTKPLNEQSPWLSWKSDSSIELVVNSFGQLREDIEGDIVLPLVGCGHGNLKFEDVVAAMVICLTEDKNSDRFTLVI
jgi:hypothetical protein